jgi:hypothetical protein
MPNFTAGTSFSANDTVTNTKLNALIADATINPECALSINSGTIGTLSCTRGTIGTFNSTTSTFLGAITASTNVINIGSGQIYKDASGNVGIGTGGTAATSKLDVYGLGNFQGLEIGKSGQTGNRNAGIDFTGDDTYTDYGFRIIRQNTGANADTLLTNRGTGNVVLQSEEAGQVLLNTSSVTRLIVNANGNVGIGTVSPATRLHLSGPDVQLRFTNGSSHTRHLAVVDSDNSFRISRTGVADDLTIDSSGNVGIGTGSPGAKLDVYGDGYFQSIELGKAGQTGNRNALIDFIGDDTYSDYGFRIIRGDTGANTNSVLIHRGTGGFFLQATEAGPIIFQTTATERLRIDSSGNVGIGTSSPSAQLELSTDSAKKPSTNTWTIASDQRLKTNITNADNDRCYEIVKQVPLKRYTWKGEVYSQEQVKDRSKLGWIAQDVEAVFPKAVGTNRFAYNQVFEDVVTPELDSDGNAVLDENGVAKTKTEKRLVSEDVIEDCKDLNSDQIYAAMYGTIQKLIEKVESLESKVAALEAA